jgi:hypothetical protein
MELKLVRSVFTDTATLGRLFINDVFFAFTLEDKERDLRGNCTKKVQNKTCIDFGRYEVALTFSNHFKKFLPLLINVPCFEGIRIHGGNTAEDSEGCILIGAESNMRDRISNCAPKLAELIQILKKTSSREKIFIDIVKNEL